MTDNKKVLAFERKLQQLKEEESLILKLLKDVRKQLKKYEVEELQTSYETVANENEGESDSDESIEGNNDLLLQMMDSAQIINNTSLNLAVNKIMRDESSDESEESEESD